MGDMEARPMKDYWNRVTDWLFPEQVTWRKDTAHSGQIPHVDIPLHTTYVIDGPSGRRYLEANTLSMTGW
jgi:hypothetical protein